MTIIAGHAHESRGVFAHGLRVLVAAVADFREGLRRRWQARAQAALLRDLDDRVLRDIGIAPPPQRGPTLFTAPARAVGTVLRTIAESRHPQ